MICDYRRILAFLGLSLFATPLFASNQCELVLLKKTELEQMKTVLARQAMLDPNLNTSASFTLYEKLIAPDKQARRLLPRHKIYKLLSDPEFNIYAGLLKKVLVAVDHGPIQKSSYEKLVDVLTANLKQYHSRFETKKIIHGLHLGKTESLFRALGKLELADVQRLTYGADPLHPSSESLLGKYLQETQASTVIRTFPTQSTESVLGEPFGQPKLVVAVSQRSFASYLKYFTRSEYLVHVHTPSQGTLYLSHQGKVGSYGNHHSDLRLPSVGTIMPHVLMSTSEGLRAERFFRLASSDDYKLTAQRPWEEMREYCAVGGYSSCTHWFGNIPIGDKLVDRYTFPGFVDRYASNKIFNDPVKDALPRTQELGHYDHPEPLVKEVWTVPGHEQLADVLGIHDANIRGELANPGWVAITLTGSTSTERVPVVFVVVADEKAPLSPDFPLFISAY